MSVVSLTTQTGQYDFDELVGILAREQNRVITIDEAMYVGRLLIQLYELLSENE